MGIGNTCESEKKCCCDKCARENYGYGKPYPIDCANQYCPCHSVPVEKCKVPCETHVWDSEEYNPHCHCCGLLMRDDSVPVEQEERCKFCSGKGYTMFKDEDCPKCWGTGKRPVPVPVEKCNCGSLMTNNGYPERMWHHVCEKSCNKKECAGVHDDSVYVPVEKSWEELFDEKFGVTHEKQELPAMTWEFYHEIKSFIRDTIKEAEERKDKEIEQLRTQLAGCSVAALGNTKDIARMGDYGWSPAYQDVLSLRIKYDNGFREAVSQERKRIVEEVKKMRDEERYSSYGSGCIEDVLKLINRE